MARTVVTILDHCPVCGSVLVLRYAPTQDMQFIGCSAWQRNGRGCPYTSAYDEAIQELGERIVDLERENDELRAYAQEAWRRKDAR